MCAYLAFALDANSPLVGDVVLRRIMDLWAVCAIHCVFLQSSEVFLIHRTTVKLALGVVYKKKQKRSVENSISNSVYRASARFMFTFNVRLPFIRLAPEWLIVKLLNEKWILDENNSRDAGKKASDVYVKSLPHLATLLRSKVHICFRTVLSGDDKKAEKERKIRFMWQSQPRHRQHNQNLC